MIPTDLSEIARKGKTGIRNPRKVYDFLIGKRLNQRSGEQVFKQDWDNLILLDGCRYDIFAEEVTFDGELQSLRSAGSTSYEYFLNNYDGRYFPEITYITANTHFHRIDAKFADIVPAREFLWDEDIWTVPPDELTNYVLDNADRYNNKRLIVHFMQPHMPFLIRTETGFKRHSISEGSGVHKVSETRNTETRPWWSRLEDGKIDRETTFDAYRNTLRIVLEEIEPLLSKLQGKTVVSADHGNAFGTNGIYGHPKNSTHQTLVKVPWFISNNGDRKRIQSADRLTSTQSLSGVDKEKLRALGYL
jgi:arylsulfatase A-like enzyme